ncbi:hypothetical protein LY76DRAFT_289211 [Colletotrichum caudatum]|nr:hypothetical protein LY76DRAFT_289211 [Colletotrichum caudatum]
MVSTQAKLLTFFFPAGSAIVGFEKGEDSDGFPLLYAYLCMCWDGRESVWRAGIANLSERVDGGCPSVLDQGGLLAGRRRGSLWVAEGGMTKLRCRDGPATLGRRAAPERGLRDAVSFASSQSRTLSRWFIWRRLVSPPPRRHGMDPPRSQELVSAASEKKRTRTEEHDVACCISVAGDVASLEEGPLSISRSPGEFCGDEDDDDDDDDDVGV